MRFLEILHIILKEKVPRLSLTLAECFHSNMLLTRKIHHWIYQECWLKLTYQES